MDKEQPHEHDHHPPCTPAPTLEGVGQFLAGEMRISE
jgi:hypothetical protein